MLSDNNEGTIVDNMLTCACCYKKTIRKQLADDRREHGSSSVIRT